MISPVLTFAGRALRPMPLAVLVLAAGCDPRTGPEPDPPLPTSCADPGGTEHRGLIAGQVTWRAADGPHRLVETVEVDSLTIEAGALVCAKGAAEIRVRARWGLVGQVVAEGTADAPIRMTAEIPSEPWGGIQGSAWVTLSHVVLEHAITGVRGQGARVVINHSLLRHFQASAVSTPDGWITLVESTVDSACLAGMNCAAVVSGGRRAVAIHFEESVIRNSGGVGLAVGGGVRDPPPLTLKGGAIEGSADIGLFTADLAFGFRIEKPIRITGGGSYPASVHLRLAAEHMATPEGQAMWMGNARDTVLINLWGSHVDSVTIRPGLVWSFAPASSGQSIDVLTLEPGAGLVMSGWVLTRQLMSEGTPEDPVEITGATAMARFNIFIGSQSPRPSRLTQTWFKHIWLIVAAEGLVGQDIVLDSSRVELHGSGIRLQRVRLHSGHIPAIHPVALEIAGQDIEIAGCEVVGSNGTGVLVTQGEDIRINDCNIHDHEGLGLENRSDAPVDARNNWWGDPAGPFGPNGAGVSGNVLYEPWLTEPVPADRLPGLGKDNPHDRNSG